MILLLLGCFLRPPAPIAMDPLAGPLADADALWARRAEEGGLERAIMAYEGLLASGDPRVSERLARAYWTAGMLADEAAQDALETGRGHALDCLLTWEGFAAGVEAAQGRITPESVAELPAEAAPCLAWGAANMVALVQVRGRGASLEIESALPLAARALELAPDGEIVAWSAGMALALDATPGPDRERAERRQAAVVLLSQAVAQAPDRLLLAVEAVRVAPELAATVLPLPGPVEPDPWALENDEARRRAASLPGSAGVAR